jgi:branched-subunit amino acid aminotransferase/4-amino-4-deoxychorismate lyase
VMITPIARGEEDEVARGQEDDVESSMQRSTGATMPSPVLPGVVRRWAMEQSIAQGLDIQRRMVTIQDVFEADELVLTNSSWGVLPVVRVEREAIGDGVVGPVAKALCEAWESMVREG